MTSADALLIMWLAFTAAAVLGVSGVLVWAVRSRQFSDQDRARYLPLDSGPPPDGPGADAQRPSPRVPRPSPGGEHVPS